MCNGIELSSGAIRNHSPQIMVKAFEVAGYRAEQVEQEFGGMLRALRFGAPPHGGIAPGVDRKVRGTSGRGGLGVVSEGEGHDHGGLGLSQQHRSTVIMRLRPALTATITA